MEARGELFRRLAGAGLGLGLTVWLLSRIELSTIPRYWRLISPGWWLASLAAGILGHLLHALRWRCLLLPIDAIPPRKLLSAYFVGLAATWLVPFRLGEAGGAYALSRMHRVSFAAAMASVITDRLIDIVWLLGALLYVLAFLSTGLVVLPSSLFGTTIVASRGLMVHAAQVLGSIFLGAVLLLLIFRVWRGWWVRCAHRLLDPISSTLADRTERVYLTFSDSLDALRRGRHLGAVIAATAAYWGLGLLGVWLLIRSYPLGVSPSFSLSLLVLVSVAAGLALPNAPAYVGTFHLAVVVGLLLDSPQIELGRALGFAVYYHLNAFLPAVLIGLFFMWRDGLDVIPGPPPGR